MVDLRKGPGDEEHACSLTYSLIEKIEVSSEKTIHFPEMRD